jgi:hypothetical protein
MTVVPLSDSDDSDELMIVDGPEKPKASSPPPTLSSPSRRMSTAERTLRTLSGKKNHSLKRTDSEVHRAGQSTIFGNKGQKDSVRHEDLNKLLRKKAQLNDREVIRKKKEEWEAKRANRGTTGGDGGVVEPTQGREDREVSGLFGKKLEEARARKERGEASDDEDEEADEDFEPDADVDDDLVGSGSEAAGEDDGGDDDDEAGSGPEDEEDDADVTPKRAREPLAEITDTPLEGDNKENVSPGAEEEDDDDDDDDDAPVFRRPKRRRTGTFQEDDEDEQPLRGLPAPPADTPSVGAASGGVGGFSQFFDEGFSQEAGERFMVSPSFVSARRLVLLNLPLAEIWLCRGRRTRLWSCCRSRHPTSRPRVAGSSRRRPCRLGTAVVREPASFAQGTGDPKICQCARVRVLFLSPL